MIICVVFFREEDLCNEIINYLLYSTGVACVGGELPETSGERTLMINYFQKYRTRKYLMRIILSINILIVSFMLLALLAAYLYSEKISLQTQREANDKVLSQINYNISFMNETVQNFAISFFYDNDMARLLYNEETDDMEDIIRKNKMDKIISYNSFVHSIVIYNNKQRGYSVNGEYSVKNEDSNLVAILNDYLDGRKQIYKMELMPVTFIPDLKHPDRTQEVFSLFMYDSLTGYNKSESALIINIKSEWLFQKMKMMNGISSNGSNRILIFDQKKEAYSPIDHRDLDLDDLKREVYRHIDSSQKQVSQFTYSSSGEKQIVNYMINPATHWVIVDIEPYIAVLDTVNKLKIAFIVVGAVCVVLAIFASLFVSNKLYSPLDHLVKQTKRLRDHDSESLLNKDEISYMSHIYTHLIDQLMKEQTKHEGNENIIRSYYLRKLITDSPTFSAHELKECMEKNYLRVNLKNGAILGVLKIDGQGRGFGKEQRFDLKLLYFAISNIMTELIVEHSAALTGEVVDILGEHLVLIFDAGEDLSLIHI